MSIRFLSENTINQIAAGEVIERPASVVKELIENAIDAGANQIDVVLEQAGKNLILISDNGSGMTGEDLKIAVERHTTSKLNESDLLDIHTFGFRGEALPSIGAISRMTITSKAKGCEKAYQIKIEGGIKSEVKTAVHNLGTRIEIRDLFFATPARLKFLKTDRTELTASVDLLKKIALAHPAISFSLTHDNKTLMQLKAKEDLKSRLIEVLGEDIGINSANLNFKNEIIQINGFVSLPTYNRATSEDQFFFVNNRPVKDKVLNIALRVAYQDYLARDRHPIVALFLQINPQLVDVNVHPAKNEVRFHDVNFIRSALINTIKDALSITGQRVSTTIASHAIGYFNSNIINKNNFTEHKEKEEKKDREGVNFPPPKAFRSPDFEFRSQPLFNTAPVAKADEIDTTFQEENFPLGVAKTQVHSTYIISQTPNSLIIIDQHAAHERLGYEKIKKTIAEKGLIKQRLLMPEVIELPDEKRADLLFSQKEVFSQLGLTIEKFGPNSIIVSETPSLLGELNINSLIQDLSDNLLELGESVKLQELIEHVTETYACHYSIRAGKVLSIIQMNELLRQMEATPFSGQCNHGRPTYVELKLSDIEKLFGRK